MMYPLAFLIWLLRYVDPTARLGLLYDIGCNFEAHLRSASPLSPYDGSDADELTTAAERSIHRGAQRNSQEAAHRSLRLPCLRPHLALPD